MTDMPRRNLGRQGWVSLLAITLIALTSVSTVGHEEHRADQDCAVCHVRHQPAADLSSAPEIGPTATCVPVTRTPSTAPGTCDHGSQVPARAPPA